MVDSEYTCIRLQKIGELENTSKNGPFFYYFSHGSERAVFASRKVGIFLGG